MARMTVAQLAEQIAELTEVVAQLSEASAAPKASKPNSRKPKAVAFPAVGSTFTYRSKAGNEVTHTIEAIRGRGKRRRAFTDNGNKFPVSLLSNEKLQAEGIVTPA